MLVRGRIRAVRVHVAVASETTMLVVSRDEAGAKVIPFIGHDLFHVAKCEWTMLSYCLFPIMEECVIERREALGGHGWHLQQLCDMTTPFTECLHHLLLVVDACAIDDQRERWFVERPRLLS